MTLVGRIYISCAKSDITPWLHHVLTAWAPLETAFQFWFREREMDIGDEVEYHAAVLLITPNYFADKDVMSREFPRFIEYFAKGRGLFWIPIQSTNYELTQLGVRKITPVWGFKADAAPTTVAHLSELQYPTVWTEVGTKLHEWWNGAAERLGDKLEDTRISKQLVIQPKIQKLPWSQAVPRDRVQLFRVLPCLIDREPQEISFRRAATGRAASSKIVFVLPGRREERADRFADRLDCCTIAAMRAKGAVPTNIEFCRVAWPNGAEGDDPKELFQEYLDALSRSARLDLDLDFSKSEDLFLSDATALLKTRMRDTRFVFWTEIATTTWGEPLRTLLTTALAWWRRFIPLPSANSDFVAPIVVLAPAATKDQLDSNLPSALREDHVQVLTELSPIEYQDMLNWLTVDEVRGFDVIGALRDKIDKLYPNGDERIPFASIDRDVATWLMALN
jgi:hypothetical protein